MLYCEIKPCKYTMCKVVGGSVKLFHLSLSRSELLENLALTLRIVNFNDIIIIEKIKGHAYQLDGKVEVYHDNDR